MSSLHPHQQRVVDERADLDEKIKRLGAFIDGPAFANITLWDQTVLRRQSCWMVGYLGVLDERIARFKS